ncbi:DUF551 domain-containing protein [Klebsiella michiganensis]|uniref:DUF551 domain-containing protein n=1 Tax=Klebsiella michiganensis TaxID=1134687 RepID=UPI0012ABEFE6|nr:DUF551 domain-containing protein [Klebsiella michiganensis]
MTKSTITREWLQQTIAELESVRDEIPFGIDTNSELELAAFRLALAAIDSEPVAYAWVSRSGKKHLTRCEPEQWRDAVIVTPLYRHAQPAQTGVDDDVRSIIGLLEANEWAEHCTETVLGSRLEAEITRLVGCAQPAPVVMDDEKLRSLFDAWFASDCSFDQSPEASEADNIAWRESYWYVWQRCRAAMFQAGNSPVIPDTWIPVSERLPERGDYLVTDGCDFDVQLFNGEEFIPGFVWEDKITHWMPLPAVPPAPTQENI